MKVKELIEKIEALPAHNARYRPWIDKKIVLGLVRELDEPQKVKVSEEEAKFLETFDFDRDSDITKALYYVSRAGWGHDITDNNNVEIKDLTENVVIFVENRKRLIKAILNGYEVEKEKQYIIKLKGVPDGAKFLKYAKVTQEWYFGMKGLYSDKEIIHTRKQLEEADFGWVFDCQGIEVEEVE